MDTEVERSISDTKHNGNLVFSKTMILSGLLLVLIAAVALYLILVRSDSSDLSPEAVEYDAASETSNDFPINVATSIFVDPDSGTEFRVTVTTLDSKDLTTLVSVEPVDTGKIIDNHIYIPPDPRIASTSTTQNPFPITTQISQ